ncbi:MAG TPA: MazG nucleotide pyrophosphohydrolase domain-containing protein [Actinomycetota bacterium]|jgi:NTP pyrophosphatase (non-canonical NTP hydrolase)|nr:MazG nucleotide pyrophosphohydrolase domain-containing protein [Actinomycetota bacterium]
MELSAFQDILRRTYLERDERRGRDATFRWLTEEVGELAKALRTGSKAELEHEFGDVIAWLASLANLVDIDLETAAGRYANGCPRCGSLPCACEFR